MRRLALLILFLSACGAAQKPPTRCVLKPGLVYAGDQLDALEIGCPLGVAPSGHPLTPNTPCIDEETGLPSDAGTDLDAELCTGEEY